MEAEKGRKGEDAINELLTKLDPYFTVHPWCVTEGACCCSGSGGAARWPMLLPSKKKCHPFSRAGHESNIPMDEVAVVFPPKEVQRERIKEHVMYSMRNFITKINNGNVRKTAHKNKLNFYTKTEVEVLPIETFAFNPFKFCPFVELEANALMDGNLLFGLDLNGLIVTCKLHRRSCWKGRGYGDDYMHGHMLDIKCPKILLELYYAVHYRKHKIKYEINAGTVPICTIEEVFNMTQARFETSCWIVGNIVSLEVGKDDWSYTSCKTCAKKVLESKDRYWCDHCRHVRFKAMLSGDVLLRCYSKYRLQVIVTNRSGCTKFLLWNKEAEQMVEKAAKKIKELCKWKKGKLYPKYFDNIVDKRFLFKLNVTYKNINVMEGETNMLPLNDLGSYSVLNMYLIALQLKQVIIAMDMRQFLCPSDSSCETLAKRSSPDIGDGTTAEAGLRVLADTMVVKTFKPYK
uniref:Putative single-stranded DNA binding protein n=1 Tax=Arachis duranensis TaxID=130453 RepID=N1NG39_ARADU|nr:putative single-stranded DNA binding protein [Arachis duranensis]